MSYRDEETARLKAALIGRTITAVSVAGTEVEEPVTLTLDNGMAYRFGTVGAFGEDATVVVDEVPS